MWQTRENATWDYSCTMSGRREVLDQGPSVSLASLISLKTGELWNSLRRIPVKYKNLSWLLMLLLSCFSRVRLCVTRRWQTTRLPRPWDSPGKSTGAGCHFLLQCMKVKSESEVAQSCPTLCSKYSSLTTRCCQYLISSSALPMDWEQPTLMKK